jgi:hypothetical protein
VLKGPHHYAAPQAPLEKTSVTAIGLSDIACGETRALVQAWKKSRGWHAMPSYHAWTDADLGPHAAYASVTRVVDEGHDYEFMFIGGAHVRAYGVDHRGKRVSEIASLSPRFGRQLKASYDLVCISGRPHAFQGAIGAEYSQARFVWFETAYLPFGENGSVGYILNAAVYRLRQDGF